jgi:TRAP-type C4-dicarboxylate transport system permease small subunit
MTIPIIDAVPGETSVDVDAYCPSESRLEWAFRWLAQITVILVIIIIAVEIVVRSLFGWSLQATNELGGYALAAIAFLGLPTCQVQHAFHRVHFLDARLSARGRAILRLVFDVLSLLCALILTWQFFRFERITWRSGDVAATNLMTPLWAPRLVMLLGAAGLSFTLLRTIVADLRRVHGTPAGGRTGS